MEKMGLAHLAPARFQPYPADRFEIKRGTGGGTHELYRDYSDMYVRSQTPQNQ